MYCQLGRDCHGFMGMLEIARLCPSPPPQRFMCSCAGQWPQFELLIRGKWKSICKCWTYFFSVASTLHVAFSVGQHWTLQPESPASSCSVCCLFVVPSFLNRRGLKEPNGQSIQIQIWPPWWPLILPTVYPSVFASLHLIVFKIVPMDANLFKGPRCRGRI